VFHKVVNKYILQDERDEPQKTRVYTQDEIIEGDKTNEHAFTEIISGNQSIS
jgi:hypothetical protein